MRTEGFEPVETVEAQEGPGALRDLLLICDHARNDVPPELGDLGVPAADMARHIAYDVGARAVTIRLAEALGAPAVLATFSRLVIDPNRGEDDPTLVMKVYDGTIVAGNRDVGPREIERRLDAYHRPYHRAVTAAIDAIEARGGQPVLLAVHSFTPQFRGRTPRPWHVGVLWDRDDRLVRPLLAALGRDPGLVVGDNKPYSGQLEGDCMWRHGTSRGLPHALIEIRNDLIATERGQADWAARLARILPEAVQAALAGDSCTVASAPT